MCQTDILVAIANTRRKKYKEKNSLFWLMVSNIQFTIASSLLLCRGEAKHPVTRA